MNILSCASFLEDYLLKNHFTFNQYGFPVFKEDMFLREQPDEILPFAKRNRALDKSRTVICFYTQDKTLYTRIEKVFLEIPMYGQFLGVCGMDLSPCLNWPPEVQLFNVYLNLLFMAVLAANGIKLLINLRTGDDSTTNVLQSFPSNQLVCVGVVGTKRYKSPYATQQFRKKTLALMPARVLFYGNPLKEDVDFLKSIGIEYRVYEDFVTADKKRREQYA